jgi:predicted nucleic acid-binding protein
MPAEVFLDTNIILYAFDTSPAKRHRAREVIARADWALSWQVVQEFAAVALHKFEVAMRPDDLQEYIRVVLWPHCRVFPAESILIKAVEIHQRHGYRFYDGLIIAAALASGAGVLYSEDLHDGQVIESVRIENPFVAEKP